MVYAQCLSTLSTRMIRNLMKSGAHLKLDLVTFPDKNRIFQVQMIHCGHGSITKTFIH